MAPPGPLAAAWRADGVGPGDVVVFQLPNWVEAGITFWAAAYLGAVVVPIVHFYGAKEVDHILRTVSPSVVVTADRFGHNDFLATYESLLAVQAEARWLVVGDTPASALPAGARPFESRLDGDPIVGPVAGRSGLAGDRRLHVGHHPRPEGRGPLAPDHRVRDAPARPTSSRGAVRPRSRARRSATSSGCSTPSSSRCSGSGR